MSNRTERDQGFGPIEMRTGHADFPGWRGLQRTGDTVLKPGRLFRAWNCQINDGEVSSRGGQTAFADLSTASTRPHCITSIFSTNRLWPDLGEHVEIRVTELKDMTTQGSDEPTVGDYFEYRGDTGIFTLTTVTSGSRRQIWLRDGVDNTSSGRETETATNSSVRIRDRVYVADLNGAIRYLSPGSSSYTTLAAAGAQFGAGSRPLAMTYQGKLVVVGAGVTKQYDITAGSWSTPAMPGGTVGFIPKGWTVWDVDNCLYVWGTVTNDAKLLKYDGTTISVVYTLTPGGSITWYQAVDLASNNGNLVITYIQQDATIVSLETDYSTSGTAFSAATTPAVNIQASRMVVAGGMIWSAGTSTEASPGPVPLLIYSYDGSEWLTVTEFDVATSGAGVDAPVDIVQIAAEDTYVEDNAAL